MIFNFLSFRSQSGLLRSKKDRLENQAAENVQSRITYEKQSKASSEMQKKEQELSYYEKKIDINRAEIERRQQELSILGNKEKVIQSQIDKVLSEGSKPDAHMDAVREKSAALQKKLDHIMTLRRHHDSEIQRLETQNEFTSAKIRKVN